MVGKILLWTELFAMYVVLFWWMRKTSFLRNIQQHTLRTLSMKTALPGKMEEILIYTGLYRKLPFLTAEKWILLQLFVIAGVTVAVSIGVIPWWIGISLLMFWWIFQYLIVNILLARNHKAVDENLLKFLDFLGNYSVTSGEITAILGQISRYLEEPLRSVLEECCYEAQTLGDTSTALIRMTGKIQHSKFGEIIRNIEVTMRYSADFTILVKQSRRSIREHMRMCQERKALAKEAWINMMILGVMTIIILKTVEGLVDVSVGSFLVQTWLGRGCLAGIGMILLLFYRQVRAIDS